MASDTLTKIVASGGLFLSKNTKRFLFLLRNPDSTWGFVGGQKEPSDSTPFDALIREMVEEIGEAPKIEKVIPLELFVSNDKHFQYNTYVLLIENEFIPILNYEHQGYAWVSFENWPRPLHQGVKNSLVNRANKSKLEILLNLI